MQRIITNEELALVLEARMADSGRKMFRYADGTASIRFTTDGTDAACIDCGEVLKPKGRLLALHNGIHTRRGEKPVSLQLTWV